MDEFTLTCDLSGQGLCIRLLQCLHALCTAATHGWAMDEEYLP